MVLLQLVDFLGRRREAYSTILPPFSRLCGPLQLDPQVAFLMARPLLKQAFNHAAAAAAVGANLPSKTSATTTTVAASKTTGGGAAAAAVATSKAKAGAVKGAEAGEVLGEDDDDDAKGSAAAAVGVSGAEGTEEEPAATEEGKEDAEAAAAAEAKAAAEEAAKKEAEEAANAAARSAALSAANAGPLSGWCLQSEGLQAQVRAVLPADVWTRLSMSFYSAFWGLSLQDVSVRAYMALRKREMCKMCA